MKNKDMTSDFYTIGHLAQFTGLTDRTIRNYISAGILKGEKVNGLWQFTPEQADAFVRDPAVRPSILAKGHGLVYDFLIGEPGKTDRTCMILDFPGTDRAELVEFFCGAISRGGYHDLRFTYDGVTERPRVILKGDTREVLELVNGWYSRRKDG